MSRSSSASASVGLPMNKSSVRRFPACWCGARTWEFYAEAEWAEIGFVKFVSCKSCGTIRQVDHHSDEVIYQDSYWDPYPAATQHKVNSAATIMREYWEWRGKGLKAHVVEPARSLAMLEIGCGWGEMLQTFKAHGWRVLGCDLGERAVRQCLEHLTADEVRQGRESVIDAADGPFDLTILWHVLEHCPKPLATLRHLASVGCGTMIVQCPDCTRTKPEILGPGGDPSPDYTLRADHLWYFRPEQAISMFEKAGFTVRRMLPAGQHRYGNPHAWTAWISKSD